MTSMKPILRLLPASMAILLWLGPIPVRGQPQAKNPLSPVDVFIIDSLKRIEADSFRYKQFELPPEMQQDMKAAFEKQLKALADQKQFREILEDLKQRALKEDINQPSQETIDLAKKLAQTPEVRKFMDSEQGKRLQEQFLGKSPEADKLLKQLLENKSPPPSDALSPSPATPPDAEKILQDAFQPGSLSENEDMMNMLNSLAERLESSKLGRMLVDSPAWQDMMMDLHLGGLGGGLGGLGQTGPLPFKGLPQLPEWIKPQSGRIFQQDWSWRPNFSNLPLPDLNGWRPQISLPRVSFPGVRVPGFSGPPLRAPSFSGGAPGNYQALGWLLLCTVAAVLLWILWSRSGQNVPAARRPTLGDWPIAPDQVTTRGQLILAFDYLALLRLGEQAAYWNHRTIAFNLSLQQRPQARRAESVQSAHATERLAAIYETVRYAESPEMLGTNLSEPQRDAVRRETCACWRDVPHQSRKRKRRILRASGVSDLGSETPSLTLPALTDHRPLLYPPCPFLMHGSVAGSLPTSWVG